MNQRTKCFAVIERLMMCVTAVGVCFGASVARAQVPEETVILQDQAFDATISAEEKQIVSVEGRPFSKEGRGEISLGLGTIASDVFVVYLPVTLRGGYHFREWMSLEASASFMGCYGDEVGPNFERGTDQRCHRVMKSSFKQLTEENLELTHVSHVVLEAYQVARFNVNPVWSPFMGKFALAGSAIVHFDLNLSAGLGVVLVEQIIDELGGHEIKASFEGNLGAGVRFVFLDLVGVRFDFRQYLYGRQENGLATASEFSLSVSFLL